MATIPTRSESIQQARNNFLTFIKKYSPKVTENTRKLDNNSLPEVISELLTVSVNEAKSYIIESDVTVNGDPVTDIMYTLKSNDIVRADLGKFLNNSAFMCVIK